jgi:integrase
VTDRSIPAPAARRREPVFRGQTRIPGLWARHTTDGAVVYELQRRDAGRMRRIKLRATSKSEAIAEARDLAADLDRSEVALGDHSLTVAALKESYIERERSVLATRSARTIDLHEQLLRPHVVPLLGPRTKAAHVKAAHLRKMIDTLKARGKSGSTIRSCVVACSAMYKHAVRDLGAVTVNPCRTLERGDMPSSKRLSEPRYLSVQEVERLLQNMTDSFRPVAACLFYSGLRVSEALGLRWSHIDFSRGTIAVPGTKSEASADVIPLLAPLAAELKAHRQRVAEKHGLGRIQADSLVFQTSGGRSPGRRNVLRAVQAAATHAGLNPDGLPPVGAHDLRHSLAASAFSLNLTPPEVARLLRHASPQVTLAVYGGLTGDAVTALGGKLAALGGS